jgi:hypothetical protein
MRTWQKTLLAIGIGAAAMWGPVVASRAADYCCVCNKDKSISIEASDELKGGFECSIKCKKPTRAKAGKCPAPGAGAAPPGTPAAPRSSPAAPSDGSSQAGASKISLFSSEDCTGEAKSVSASTANLADRGIAGIRSYRVDAGEVAAAFEKADFSGRRVEPVGVGLCVSPGFDVGAIRLGKP